MRLKENKKMVDKFQEWANMYEQVFRYNHIQESFPNGKGDLQDVVSIASGELKKRGVKDEDLEEIDQEFHRRYLAGDRTFFTEIVGQGAKKAVGKFKDYAGKNLTEILDSTDDKLLEGVVVPYILENKKVNDSRFVEYHNQIKKLRKAIRDFNEMEENPTKRKEIATGLVKEKKEYYEKTYSEDKDLVKILTALVSEEGVLQGYQIDLQKKQKKVEDLKKDLNFKEYIKSANLNVDDMMKIYAPIFEQSIQHSLEEAQKKGKKE